MPRRAPAVERTGRYHHVVRQAFAADATEPRYRPMVYLAAVLGLRWSEVAGLQVGRLDLLGGAVTISATLAEPNGVPELADVKSAASRRTLPLPPFLVAMLAAHLQAEGVTGAQRDAFVFTSPQGGPLQARNFRSRVWDPAVRRAGLDGLTFHELRHTAAAVLIAEGFHAKVIQQRLGHASSKTTLDIYGHLLEGVDAGVTARLEQLFGAVELRYPGDELAPVAGRQ